MKIIFTAEEAEQHFHNALCNGSNLPYYGLTLDYSEADYAKAKKSLVQKQKKGKFGETICREDVWLEILKIGGKLTLIDEENAVKPKSITLKHVHTRIGKTPLKHLVDAINENDDADTADAILQTVFYGEVIFG
jgi:hypothetical protein